MIQNLLVGAFFLAALFYLGRLAKRAFMPPPTTNGCGSKCGCSPIKPQKQLVKEQA
jgi:hypothetical protein